MESELLNKIVEILEHVEHSNSLLNGQLSNSTDELKKVRAELESIKREVTTIRERIS